MCVIDGAECMELESCIMFDPGRIVDTTSYQIHHTHSYSRITGWSYSREYQDSNGVWTTIDPDVPENVEVPIGTSDPEYYQTQMISDSTITFTTWRQCEVETQMPDPDVATRPPGDRNLGESSDNVWEDFGWDSVW